MACSTTPTSFLRLGAATTIQEQIAALKKLKNDIIGHDLRKETCIRSGVVGVLVELLNGALRAGGKRRRVSKADEEAGTESTSGQTQGRPRGERRASVEQIWSHEDELRLQCTIVVGSLAQGGLAHVEPLLVGSIVPVLMPSLSPQESPAHLTLQTLRALLVCTDAMSSGLRSLDGGTSNAIADELFSKSGAGLLAEIMAQTYMSRVVQEQQSLVAQLITSTCVKPLHQTALVKAGVLDLLSGKLASSIVCAGFVKPPQDPTEVAELPPALPAGEMAHILEAISTIVINSSYRCARFIYNPMIVSIFPLSRLRTPESNLCAQQWYSGPASSLAAQDAAPEGIDGLLPQIAATQSKGVRFSKAWPWLTNYHHVDTERSGDMLVDPQPPTVRTMSQEFGSQLVSWLVHMSRAGRGLTRLAAVWLVIHILREKDHIIPDPLGNEMIPRRSRDRILSYLMVPLLVRMIEDASNDSKTPQSSKPQFRHLSSQRIKVRATLALGLLVEDSPALQRAAVDSGAIKLLCQMLKRTFDPIADTRRPMWNPIQTDGAAMDVGGVEQPEHMRLGPADVVPEVVHALRCRAVAMEALAHIGQVEDGFRKSMIDNGIVACMVDSMIPYPEASAAAPLSSASALDGKKGNPRIVIIAACKLSRALSRSVNILRTSLIDGGLAKPALELLKHSNMSIKREASNIMCNLLLQFSPMREELIKGGCIKILCSHAHSTDRALQTSSLWALKHLVSASSNKVKMMCLEELGAGWLIQTMTGENAAFPSKPIGMGAANAAGEQVDILNSTEDAAMEVDDSSSAPEAEEEAEDEEASMTSPILPSYLPHGTTGQSLAPPKPGRSQHRTRLKMLKREEQDTTTIAWRHDVRIQEQALDFVRNLIGDPQTDQHEMIDHIFNTLQTQRLFDILRSKLRVGGSPQRGLTGGGAPKQPASTRNLPRPANMQQRFGPGSASSAPLFARAAERIQAGTPAPLACDVVSPPSGIVTATLYIMVHIANGRSSQRKLLLSQTALMSAVLPHFAHPDRLIRIACLWLTQNLLWLDSKSTEDQISARQRARELRSLGIEDRVREALRDDDLDVYQRARGVCEALDRLLGDQAGAGPGAVGDQRSAAREAREGGSSSSSSVLAGRSVGTSLSAGAAAAAGRSQGANGGAW